MSDEKVVRLMCPRLTCQRILSVPDEVRGKLVKCRSCGTTLRVPLTRPQQVEAPPQSNAEEAS